MKVDWYFNFCLWVRVSLVSVPLRGSGDERFGTRIAKIYFGAFQSPCGEVVMKAYIIRYKKTENGFQSPCGEVVMKDAVQSVFGRK